MANPQVEAWARLRNWFSSNADEWGGTRLLLRVVPKDYGRITDGPPFDRAMVQFEGTIPGKYPVAVLRVQGRDYVVGNPNRPEAGLIFEHPSTEASTRVGLFWFQTRTGFDRLREKAKEAGAMLGEVPSHLRPHLTCPLIDPFALEEPDHRWFAAVVSAELRKPVLGPTFPYSVVDPDHVWTRVHINRGERESWGRTRSHFVMERLARDPLDDYAMVMDYEVYAASANAASSVWAGLPRQYDWNNPGRNPDETPERRLNRLLGLLLEAKSAPGNSIGQTPWRSLSGATQLDFEYLVGQDLIEAGCASPDGRLEYFQDPECTTVWLKPSGLRAALENRARAAGSAETLPRPEAWRDNSLNANERVFAYRLHLALNGVRLRPLSKSVEEVTGVPETTIRNTDAWKTWPQVDLPGGGLADQHRSDRGSHSGRVVRDRIEREERE